MILVDTRAGSNELIKPLQAAGLATEPTFLEYADLMFEGRGTGGVPVLVGIEYKKLGELFTALSDDRLVGHQVPGMVQSYDYSYLLVEGERAVDPVKGRFVRHGRGGRLRPVQGSPTRDELYKRLLTLTHRAGIVHIPSLNQTDTIAWISALYHFWTDRALDEHKSHLALYQRDIDDRLRTPPSNFKLVMQGIPGVGPRLLDAAEYVFDGSVTRAVLAPAETWAEIVTTNDGKVRRVGMKTALKIKEVLK